MGTGRKTGGPGRETAMAMGGAAVIMAVIIALWVRLLPLELEYGRRKASTSPVWGKVSRDSRDARDDWRATVSAVGETLGRMPFGGEASTVAGKDGDVAADSGDDLRQDEIGRFGQELERAAIEKVNQTQP
ncbi:hypothetical protein JW899_01420 [Candidatus Uhrbacteria bacterium]|nr:hypothetical protein [Candidatus Uhrbacteria bacterium]